MPGKAPLVLTDTLLLRILAHPQLQRSIPVLADLQRQVLAAGARGRGGCGSCGGGNGDVAARHNAYTQARQTILGLPGGKLQQVKDSLKIGDRKLLSYVRSGNAYKRVEV